MRNKVKCDEICPFWRENRTYNVCFLYGRVIEKGDPCLQYEKRNRQRKTQQNENATEIEDLFH